MKVSRPVLKTSRFYKGIILEMSLLSLTLGTSLTGAIAFDVIPGGATREPKIFFEKILTVSFFVLDWKS